MEALPLTLLSLEMTLKALQLVESALLLNGWSRYSQCSGLIPQISPYCLCAPVGLVWFAFSGQDCGFFFPRWRPWLTDVAVPLVGWLWGGANVPELPCRIWWSHSGSVYLRSHLCLISCPFQSCFPQPLSVASGRSSWINHLHLNPCL